MENLLDEPRCLFAGPPPKVGFDESQEVDRGRVQIIGKTWLILAIRRRFKRS